MCHQSSVCSSAFSLKHFVLHNTTPLSVVVCSSVRHISIGARFSHLIGFYHHFRCEVTGVPGVISEGGSNARRQLSKERERGRGRGRSEEFGLSQVQIHLCLFVFLFLCVEQFPFTFFVSFVSQPRPAAVLRLVSLFVVAAVVLCVNVCAYTTGGSDLSSCLICHPH